MRRSIGFCVVLWIGIALQAQSLYPDFSKMNFGCDGNSITAGEQWSKTVVDLLGFSTHHNVAVGSATWAWGDGRDAVVDPDAALNDHDQQHRDTG